MKPRIKYYDLQFNLMRKYHTGWYWGSPPMFSVYDEKDKKEEDLFGLIYAREGAFELFVSKIVVYSKQIDSYLQTLLGLDYDKVRVDKIKEGEERREDSKKQNSQFDEDNDDGIAE